MEGTDEADSTAEAQASVTETAGEEVPQTPADTTAAQTDAVNTNETEAGTAADETQATDAVADAALNAADTADAPAAADSDEQATANEQAADSDKQATATEQATAMDETAAATDGIGTSDPSDDAAVGSSGARALGDAVEVNDRVNEAIERMQDGADVAEAGSAGDGADEIDFAPAADDAAGEDEAADAATATTVDEGTPAEAEGASEAAAPAPPAAPAPRVYEGPEPTTMEELLNEQATEIRSLKHGDVVEGSVVRIDKDEILVDIGAKSEGVISNRELYGRNTETQPQLNIGDVVLVYVLQPESPEGHAVLSLRRAGLERKWRSMQEQLDAGAIIDAPVIDHNKGGLIVDCGIRGFVPISQIVDFPRRPQNEQPRDAAQEIAEKLQPYVGRKLRLKILEVNRKANRLILSEKVALYEERREKRDELFSSLQVGQKVTGTVRSIAPFGVFIDLGGIDGLVHKSELSWNKVNNPEAGYRVGEEVEAEVIDINHERGRISLSIRRLQPDPWSSTVADLKVGDIIDGTVTKIVNFGAFVRVRDGLEGLIHISELSHARVAHPGDVVHEGQTLKLKIISLEQERHRLGLSLKQAEEAPARAPDRPSAPRERRPRQERGYDMSQAVQEPEGGIDNTLAAAFAQVRAQMAETESSRDESSDNEAPVPAETISATAATGDEAPTELPAATAASQAPEATEQLQGSDQPEVAAETADAPALEVPAAAEPKPAGKRGKAAAAAAGTEEASTDGEDAEATATAAAPEAEPATTEAPAEAEVASPAAAADPEPEPEPASATAVDEPEAMPESPADPAEGAAEPTGDALSETATEPAEGSDEAAPSEGADKDDSAG
jgi:small subunit ribosomal protein S1